MIKGFLRLEIAIEHELHHHVDRLLPCANTQEFDDITVVKPGDHGSGSVMVTLTMIKMMMMTMLTVLMMTTLNIENDHGDDVKTMITIKLLHHLSLGDNLDNIEDNLDNDDDDMILRMMSTIVNLFIISASLRKSIFSSTVLPAFKVFTATATLGGGAFRKTINLLLLYLRTCLNAN